MALRAMYSINSEVGGLVYSARLVGADFFRLQLWVPTGTVG